MSPETEKLLQKALALPAEDRGALAASLLDSLDQTVDGDAETAWQQEISRLGGGATVGISQGM